LVFEGLFTRNRIEDVAGAGVASHPAATWRSAASRRAALRISA
jgi:hypothetical protein